MNWYLKVLKQYADFGGRARRKELWMFVLVNGIIANAIMFLENTVGITTFEVYENMSLGVFHLTYNLAVLIPSLAVGVRRFHDIGKSGWNYLIGLIPLAGVIILLVWFCKDSQPGENKWGANPKE